MTTEKKQESKKAKKCPLCDNDPSQVTGGYCHQCGLPHIDEPVWAEMEEEAMRG